MTVGLLRSIEGHTPKACPLKTNTAALTKSKSERKRGNRVLGCPVYRYIL